MGRNENLVPVGCPRSPFCRFVGHALACPPGRARPYRDLRSPGQAKACPTKRCRRFTILTPLLDSHIPQGYQGRSPWLVKVFARSKHGPLPLWQSQIALSAFQENRRPLQCFCQAKMVGQPSGLDRQRIATVRSRRRVSRAHLMTRSGFFTASGGQSPTRLRLLSTPQNAKTIRLDNGLIAIYPSS